MRRDAVGTLPPGPYKPTARRDPVRGDAIGEVIVLLPA
jgi:hypothetical protein